MRIFPWLHLRETKFIHILPRQCQGCGKCIEVCPENILMKRGRTIRHHVHIRNPEACTGCKKCVRACECHAIDYIYIPRPLQRLPEKEL